MRNKIHRLKKKAYLVKGNPFDSKWIQLDYKVYSQVKDQLRDLSYSQVEDQIYLQIEKKIQKEVRCKKK